MLADTTDRVIRGKIVMKEVILSADDKAKIYSVPNDVAQNLEAYCLEFCTNWIWKNPKGAKLLKIHKGQKVAVYNTTDFIEYLNDWIFPNQHSELIEELEFYNYELPEEYKEYPQFNF